MKLKSKPHSIEAFQFTGKDVSLPEWFKAAYHKGRAASTFNEREQCIIVFSKQGSHKAYIDDWVCMNTSGTLFVLSDTEVVEGFEIEDSYIPPAKY